MLIANQKFRVGVLGLQGSVIGHIQALHELGATSVEVRLSKHLEDLDKLIIPGRESTTMYKLTHAFDVFEVLKAFIYSGRTVYGSCAGMTMPANYILDRIGGQETLGGLDVTVRRNAFGRQVDSAASHIDPGGFGGDTPLSAVFVRAPWVEPIGSKVQVFATQQQTPESSPHAVAVRQGSLLAMSFYPEVTSDRQVRRYFLDMVTDYIQ